MDPVAQRIKELIEELALSNKDFAESIDIAPAIISHVLSGRNKPSLHLVQQITNVYTDVNLAYLLQGKGDLMLRTDDPRPSSNASNTDPGIGPLPAGARYVQAPSGFPLPKKEGPKAPKEDVEPIKETPVKDKDEELTNVYTNVNSSKRKTIERIVIFYGDKSFEEYRP